MSDELSVDELKHRRVKMRDELSVAELKFLVLLNESAEYLVGLKSEDIAKGEITEDFVQGELKALKWAADVYMRLRSKEIKHARSAED